MEDNFYDSLLEDPTQEELQESNEFQGNEEIPLFPEQSELDELASNDNVVKEDTSESNDDLNEETNDDVISSYLKSRGISDPKKIQFENDEGGIDEVDFNSLSKEEQLNILNELSSASDYSDYEKQVIDFVRQNGGDLRNIVQAYQEQAIKDYLEKNPDQVHQKQYSIDEYTDDELYIADLAIKFPEFSEDELHEKLDSAKTNEELFKKEVDALRAFYKSQEDREAEDAKISEQKQQEAIYNSLMQAANNFNEVALDLTDPKSDSLILEDQDKQLMLSYLLDSDQDGRSGLDKDLSDPRALMEIAWLRTQGRETLSNMTQYWKKELAATRKELSKVKKELEKYTTEGNNIKDTKQSKRKEKISNIDELWTNVNY